MLPRGVSPTRTGACLSRGMFVRGPISPVQPERARTRRKHAAYSSTYRRRSTVTLDWSSGVLMGGKGHTGKSGRIARP
jgi:hypothetical protein